MPLQDLLKCMYPSCTAENISSKCYVEMKGREHFANNIPFKAVIKCVNCLLSGNHNMCT